jgi:tRNA/tmRNA/rRNA uracil-C5-methylase (TrmA/RlmC/RlmD family)
MLPTHLELIVEKPAAGGRMIARYDGQVVLVAAAIPGERVRARVERVSKGVIYATTVDVLHPSPDRRKIEGDWLCGGNIYAHVAYRRQLEIKADVIADAFARIARMPLGTMPALRPFDRLRVALSEVEGRHAPGGGDDAATAADREAPAAGGEARARVPVTGSEERGYRMRARLHVRNGRVGFYREGTHDLCDPASTGQLLPQTLEALDRVGRALYREQTAGVTSIDLSENMPGDQRVLHVEIDRPADLSPVADEVGADLTGLSYSGPFARMSSIVAGSPLVTDRVLISTEDGEHAMTLQRDVRAFFQGNRYLLPTLVTRVLSLVVPGPVVDLYAGVGLFGVALAACGREDIVAVEGDRVSAQDLKANAAAHGAAIAAMREPVETYLARRAALPDASLIVDPPRTGMSREALAGILAWRPPAIVYVSCDVATLARDVRRLLDAGYVLDHIEAFDLFPNTAHVETVVRLTRSSEQRVGVSRE